MKISNSKKELARIISENGGWRDGAEWAAQDKRHTGKINKVVFYLGSKPWIDAGDSYWGGNNTHDEFITSDRLIKNWHQTILSREEYFHLYQAPDADRWIGRATGECPVSGDFVVDVKFRDGETDLGHSNGWNWSIDGGKDDIIAYRLHDPEQAKPEFCESVMRSIPEPEDKPTIEQLAAEYRNAKDYAERKQQEADDARYDADAKLKALELAGEAHGLLVTPITTKQEPELVITDWRDLQAGDVVKITSVFERGNEDYRDAIGTDAVVIHVGDPARQYLVVSQDDMKLHIDGFRFIHRP